MNIYSAYWVEGGTYGLSAVVVAETEEAALGLLNLDEDDTGVQISLLGVETDPSTRPWVVAEESL